MNEKYVLENKRKKKEVVRRWPPMNLFYLWGSYVCANFGENRSRHATVRVCTYGYADTLTDAKWFYNLFHAICYSYRTDN